MMNRQQRRERERIEFLVGVIAPAARAEHRIVPDTQHVGPGRSYYCVRANGDWFKARLDGEYTQ
jgi:hypothetical protein